MNLDDALDYARQHKAATIGAGAAALLVLLYLRHRAKTMTASDTAGTTGATVNGAGDYLVPFSNSSDPTGMSSDNGNLANAITGLTTTLNGLSIQRSTDPTSTAQAARKALDPHEKHLAALAHAQHLSKVAPHLLDQHQLAMLHAEHVKNKGLKARKPTAPKAPIGAHTGQTSTPGGATSTGPAIPLPIAPLPPRLARRLPAPIAPIVTR